MNLHRTVLNGISKRKTRKKSRKRKRRIDFHFFQETTKEITPPSLPASAPKQTETMLQSPVEAESSRTAPSFPSRSPGLSIQGFVSPDGVLRRSVEGFLMDQRSPHTQRAYGKDIKRFVKFLLARNFKQGPEDLDRNVIVAYKDWLLTDGLEHTTVDRHLATLRSLFGWMVDEGIIERNPAEKVRFLKPKRLSTTIGFSDEEVKKILSLPNLHKKSGAQHYAILMILFYCGLRRGELVQLRTSHFGVEHGHHVLRLRGKGNVERVIPVIRPVWNSLQYWMMMSKKVFSEDQFLFNPTRNNRTGEVQKPLDTSAIYYIVTQYAKEAGIANRVSPHSCRATAISNARDHQVADRAIQEFAGWSSPDMITRYDKRKTAIEDSAAHSIRYGQDERVPDWIKNRDD